MDFKQEKDKLNFKCFELVKASKQFGVFLRYKLHNQNNIIKK